MSLRRVIYGVLVIAVTGVLATLTAFARPEPFFAHSRTVGNISFYDTSPIPAEADAVLLEIFERLQATLRPQDVAPLKLFVADEGWRNQLYFGWVPGAGGVVYPFSDRNGFLSGADFRTGRLLKQGRIIQPPRTLAYYGAHELTHVITGKMIGPLDSYFLPVWIREGLADSVALGPADPYALDAALGDRDISMVELEKYGSYPRKWMLVSWFLDHEQLSVDQLLTINWTEAEALARMRKAMEETG